MCCLMPCYPIHLSPLTIFPESYPSPNGVCGQNRDPLNSISASKAVALSMININYLLHFLGKILFTCVVTIPIKNISNQNSTTLAD